MLRKPISFVAVALMLSGLAGLLTGAPAQGQAPQPQAMPGEPASYRDVVKKVLPTVVSIDTRGKMLAQEKSAPKQPQFDDSRIPEPFRKLFEEFAQPGLTWNFFKEYQGPLTMPDSPRRGFGSGFIVDPKGVIMTNYHVVKDAEQVVVQLHDGRRFTAKGVASDPKTDLAIVRIEAKEPLPYLQWGNSDAMEIGDRVLAVGAPFGLRGSVSAGIISGKSRNLGMNPYDDFLQTDAAINPGNSGGPLVNLQGQVVGIDTAIKSQSGGSQGVGLAIGSNMARTIEKQLTHQGQVHRGYLGVKIQNLSPEAAAHLGIPNHAGVVVAQVMDGAPAARAGLRAGDIITSLAGSTVKDARDLQRMAADRSPGKPVEVTVMRDGKEMRFQIAVEEQPRELGSTRTPATAEPREDHPETYLNKIGIGLGNMTPALAQQFGYKDQTGVVITRVEPGSLAAEAGLERGELIVKVDKAPVHSAAEAQQALEKAELGKGILLQVRGPQTGVSYLVLQSTSGQ
jgi:serine protease Do